MMIPARSQAMDNVLYHQYLKGEVSSNETDSVHSDATPSQVDCDDPPKSPAYHWDLQETCKPLFPAFDYISETLSQEGLSIHLIVSDQSPFIIPVWHLPPKSQIILCKIIRKACKKFGVTPSWMTALSSIQKKDLPTVFETYTPGAYVVRRSMLQREVVYSSEGLTLLSIDHIYTLKQLLCTLSKREWVSTSRAICLASCVHLLHRIHSVYTGKPASAGYIERVYKEVPFQDEMLKEVVAAYNASYCTASIYEVAFQPDFSSLPQQEEATISRCSSTVPELPEETTHIPPTSSIESSNDDTAVSPLADLDLSTLHTWDIVSISEDYEVAHPPQSITHPVIQKPSSLMATARSTSASPEIAQSITPSTAFPPPPPPPSYPLPSPPSSPQYSISSLDEEAWMYDSPPSPLRISKPFPRATSLPLLSPSVFSDAVESAVEGEFLWELDVLESPRQFIESWSTATAGALCERCHDIVGPTEVGRRGEMSS